LITWSFEHILSKMIMQPEMVSELQVP